MASHDDLTEKDSNILGKDIEVIFNETLSMMDEEEHPRIVENFLKKGYRTKRPELQEIEHSIVMDQSQIEEDALSSLQDFQNSINLAFKMAKSTVLMTMGIEEVIAKVEKAKSTKISSFPELLAHMATLSNEEALMAAQTETSSTEVLEHCNDVGMFPDVDSAELKTPVGATQSTNEKTKKPVFPSSSEMLNQKTEDTFVTPATGVFRFGSAAPPSTTKAPRAFKSNEIAYSAHGSPVYVSKTNPVLDGNKERFIINDIDGKKIVEVVLIQGDVEKLKEFKSVVTDIRGLVATRSTVKATRLLRPRIPTRGVAATTSSAMKIPNQQIKWK